MLASGEGNLAAGLHRYDSRHAPAQPPRRLVTFCTINQWKQHFDNPAFLLHLYNFLHNQAVQTTLWQLQYSCYIYITFCTINQCKQHFDNPAFLLHLYNFLHNQSVQTPLWQLQYSCYIYTTFCTINQCKQHFDNYSIPVTFI